MSQFNVFELLYQPYVLPKKVRLFEAFSGIGCQRLAFKKLGVEVEIVGISEIDKYAIQSYTAIHGETENYGSITDINGQDLPQIDVFTWSFPCFTKDMLILTDKGYKKIIDVKENDLVLTHDNTYQKVVRFIDNGVKDTVKINGMAFDEIICTPNHRFYSRKMKRVYFHNPNTQSRIFESPKWVSANELTKEDYLGVAINKNSVIPNFKVDDQVYADGRVFKAKNVINGLLGKNEFWYIVGRYLGDGWLRHQGGIIICCKFEELEEITSRLDILNINYTVVKDRTVYKIHVPTKEFGLYFEQFGKGASNKRLTKDVFDLPIYLLESLIEGYIDADGYITKDNVYKTSSVSKELTYGIGHCVAKVYKTPFKIYKSKRKGTCVIEGRTVNQKDSYQLVFKKEVKKQDKAFYEDGYIWFPIKSIEYNQPENVYDLEVEKSHSFTVNNVIVHNCTDLSKAGKRKGMSEETRSGLVYEVLRILHECTDNKPKVLIMENVVDLVQTKFVQQFNEIQLELEELGYTNYVETLNAKDFGVAQNRDRVFMVSILGDYYYEFPKPIPLEKRLKDYLEDEVDEKYYLSDRALNGIKNTTYNSSTLDARTEKDGVIPTLCARDYKDPKLVVENIKAERIGGIFDKAGKRHQAGSIWDKEQLSPTLDTMQGGHRQPCITEDTEHFIPIPEATTKGYAEAYEGDGVYINRPHQKRGVVQKEMIQTLKTNGNDVGVVVESETNDNRFFRQALETLEENDVEYGDSINAYNKSVDKSGESPTITTRPEGFKTAILPVTNNLRIRKLSPLECWRLMGIDDEDFYKAAYKTKRIIFKEDNEEWNVRLKDVTGNQKPDDTETFVLNITNDSNEQAETSIEWTKCLKELGKEKKQNVNIAIEKLAKLGHSDYATSIIKCTDSMETLTTLTDEKDPLQTVIIELDEKVSPNTAKYMKITSGENLNPLQLFITLILLKQIIESRISISTLQQVNICGFIENMNDSEKNTENQLKLSLKTDATFTRNSASQLYKQAGNGIVIDVFAAILGKMLDV